MRFAKIFLITFAVLALVGGSVWQFWLKEQMAFAQIATAYVAKQTCSCRFVAERSLESCLVDFTQDVSQLEVSEVPERRAVKASALGLIVETASYRPGLGCALDPG